MIDNLFKKSSELSSAHVSQFQEDLIATKKELDSLEHQLRIEKQVNLEAIDANKKLAQKSARITASVREEHEREVSLMKTVYEKEKELLELDIGQREAVIKLLREGRDISEVDNFQRETQHNFGESEV